MLDNFERARKSISPADEEGEVTNARYLQMNDELMATLGAMGVEPIPTVGTEFDYNLHMAIQQVSAGGRPACPSRLTRARGNGRGRAALVSQLAGASGCGASMRFHDASLLFAVQMPSDEYEEGIVLSEMQTGFTCKGKLIRPAYVMVSAGM